MHKQYNISLKQGSGDIYVTVLTKCGTHSFWNELKSEIRNMDRPNAVVYFDYLYRNGFNNRLFCSRTDLNSNCLLDIKPLMETDESFDIGIFDQFYAFNTAYLANSMLPVLQRSIYIKKLKQTY